MKKTVIIGIVMLLCAVAGLRAQDTIDTNYYRYDNHFLRMGARGFINPETGEYVEGCPNGFGFTAMGSGSITPRENGYWGMYANGRFTPYMYYKLSKAQDVYGIAIPLDSIDNFTNGDSLTVILCDVASDHSHFIHLDSITIKGGEIGKRRWMEIPIIRNDLSLTNTMEGNYWEDFEPYDNCIDTVLYRQVLEFYFDEPQHLSGPYLWWKLRVETSNGSAFILSYCNGYNMCFVGYYDEHCVGGNMYSSWDYFFPLITPLPEWEEPSMTQLIPYPEGAVIPDPQDPDDPQNPDDPDNPGGDEGIGHADAFGFTIYPNPASGYAVVTCDQPIQELTLCDVNGRMIRTMRNCGGSAKIDTSELAPGVYMMRITTDAGTATRKLAVK